MKFLASEPSILVADTLWADNTKVYTLKRWMMKNNFWTDCTMVYTDFIFIYIPETGANPGGVDGVASHPPCLVMEPHRHAEWKVVNMYGHA